MKDKIRQIAVVLSSLLTIVVNSLANALPLNGQTTAEISDRFVVYFTPAGYVFSIWGVIYIGLVAFTIFQALPSQRENPRLRAIGWWMVAGSLANSAWIFFWHYEVFPLTLVVMLALLVSLIVSYLRIRQNQVGITTAERLTVQVPLSIYLGWITVATTANITSLLDFWKWNAWGISSITWLWIVLGVVVILTGVMTLTQKDIVYDLVILWSVAGIGVKHTGTANVATAAWIAFGLVSLMVITTGVRALIMPKKKALSENN